MSTVIKYLKSFQSFLTVAGCIIVIFGTGGGVVGNPVNNGRNPTSNHPFTNQKLLNFHQEPHYFKAIVARNATQKRPRFLTSLFNSDTMKCVPQVMCELISANEPGPDTDTVNDYKYLVKEFFLRPESGEDNGKTKQPERYRSNGLKTKAKQKIAKKRKNVSGSSSDESSASLPSEEEKRNGVAQLMDLEEEEAIDNKAISSMVGEDPDDFLFALADAKQKHKHHQMATSRLNNDNQRFHRNVEALEKTLAENRRPNIFRASRAIQSQILEGKVKELEKTQNVMDRVRIAAEVGSLTRSGRQCRALFDTNSCSVNTQGIQGLVQNVRKAISGSGNSNRNTDVIMQEIKTLLREVQSWQGENVNTKSGPDVKVVLNIGGPSPQQIQEAAMSSIGTGYQPQSYWPQTTPTTTTTAIPLRVLSTKMPPTKKSHWPKLKLHKTQNGGTTTPDKVVVKSEGSLKDQELREQYRLKLKQAANLLRLPWGLPKNLTTTKRKSTLKSTSHDKKSNAQRKFPKQSPKMGNSLESSDSDSLESSEEEDGEALENVNIFPLQNNGLTFLQNPWPSEPQPTHVSHLNQNFYRELQLNPVPQFHGPGGLIASVPAFNSQSDNRFHQRATTGSSLVSNVYDLFFRKVLPLPHDSSEWIPSALRHGGRRNPDHRNSNYQRFGDSRNSPYSRRIQIMPPPEQSRARPRRPRPKPSKNYSGSHRNRSNKNVKNRRRNNSLKYKTCCSSSSNKAKSTYKKSKVDS